MLPAGVILQGALDRLAVLRRGVRAFFFTVAVLRRSNHSFRAAP